MNIYACMYVWTENFCSELYAVVVVVEIAVVVKVVV